MPESVKPTTTISIIDDEIISGGKTLDLSGNPKATQNLVAQLRETRRMNVPYQLMMDAANEIERLRGIIRELRAVHESMGDLFISTQDEIR